MSKPGHNSKVQAGPIQADRLKSFIERIEKLEEERKAIGGDIKDVYSEAKGVGYDVKTVRWVVQERRMDASDRAERDTLRDVYQHALDTAVGLVRGGLSLREAGRITGTSKSSIHRALAVPSVSQPASPKPEDGDDGITGGEYERTDQVSVAAGHHQGGGEGSRIGLAGSPVAEAEEGGGDPAEDRDAGTGLQVARPLHVSVPVDEAPATPSVGAVAREPATERVASSSDDDDLDIPAHLRGPSPANRRVA